MIEVFNIERTKSLGCFVNFKSAKGTLNRLIASGELSGENPSVLVCSYKNNEIQREYMATYSGKWRVSVSPKILSFSSLFEKKVALSLTGAN